MKHLLLFLVIIIGILIINCSLLEGFLNIEDNYLQPNIELKHSAKINDRGVFANKDYKKDDIIEICPGILVGRNSFDNRMNDYLFSYDEDNDMVGFGYCSMYNDSDTPNASWSILSDNILKILAVDDIKKGDEIFVSYGDNYWKTRNIEKK